MSKRSVWLFACACVVAACSSQGQFGADAGVDAPTLDAAPQVVTDEATLRNDMQAAWIDDVAWTRFYVVDVLGHLPEASFTLSRLHANQDRLVGIVRPFIGAHGAEQLGSLLHDHVVITERVLTAAVTNDQDLLLFEGTWYSNANAIAHFLATVNPSLVEDTLQAQLRKNLDQTIAEMKARIGSDWNGDVTACDAAVSNIVTMSNSITDGFFTQFRQQIAATSMTQKEETLDVAFGTLWDQRALWMRNAIVSQTSRLADFDVATARLLVNQSEIANAFRPFYGDAMAAQLTTLLQNDVHSALATLTALEGRDEHAIASARATWYASADAIARLLASSNPNWPLADLEAQFRQVVDKTITEMNARIGADWQADIAAHDALVAQLLDLSQVIVHGIAAQFPENLK